MTIKHTGTVQDHFFTAIAGGTIVAGDVVAYNLADTSPDSAAYNQVVKADSDSWDTAIVAGVAINGGSAGAQIVVQFYGKCDSVNVDAACVAGSPLYAGATAGRADVVVATPAEAAALPSRQIFGYATAADSSNIAPAFLLGRFPR
jgi:hypothetical protein